MQEFFELFEQPLGMNFILEKIPAFWHE